MKLLLTCLATSFSLVLLAVAGEPKMGFETVNLVLYQPDDVLRDRMPRVDLLSGYVKNLQRICEEYFADSQTPEILDVVVAIKPSKRARVWFVSSTRSRTDTHLASLRAALEAVEPPGVRNGPVAVAISATIAGGERQPPDPNSYAPPIPKEWAEAAAHPDKPIPDGVLEVLWPEDQ